MRETEGCRGGAAEADGQGGVRGSLGARILPLW